MMLINSMCITCKQKNNTFKEHKLLMIKQFVLSTGIKPVRSNRYYFMWEISGSCKYGISCPALLMYSNDCDQIARYIEPYIIGIAKSGNSNVINRLLSLLQGDFAPVYRLVENIVNENVDSCFYD